MPTTQNLLVTSNQLTAVCEEVNQSWIFDEAKAKKLQACYLDIAKRFQFILKAINEATTQPIVEASIGMDFEETEAQGRYIWMGPELIFNNHYFDAATSSVFDIEKLNIFFTEKKIPKDIIAMIKELIEFAADVHVPFAHTKIVANLTSARVEFFPVYSQSVDLSISA